jgi:hypothetical protein
MPKRTDISKILIIGTSIFFTAGLAQSRAQEARSVDSGPNTVDRLCGKLQHLDRHPTKDGKSYTENRKGLRNVALKLYKGGKNSCCEAPDLLEETSSRRGGEFRFKSQKPASYWIVAIVNGREYKIPIRLESPRKPSDVCSDKLFQANDDGEFSLGRVITLD